MSCLALAVLCAAFVAASVASRLAGNSEPSEDDTLLGETMPRGLTNPLYRHCMRGSNQCFQVVTSRPFMIEFICGKAATINFGTCASQGFTCEKDKTKGTAGVSDSLLHQMISVGVSYWLPAVKCSGSGSKQKELVVEDTANHAVVDVQTHGFSHPGDDFHGVVAKLTASSPDPQEDTLLGDTLDDNFKEGSGSQSRGLSNPIFRHCIRSAGQCYQVISNRVFMIEFICGSSEIKFGTCAGEDYTCSKDKTSGTSGVSDSLLMQMIQVGVSYWLPSDKCKETLANHRGLLADDVDQVVTGDVPSRGLPNPLYRHCVHSPGSCSQATSNRVFMIEFLCGKTADIKFGTCASEGYTCERDKTKGTAGVTDSLLHQMISVGVSYWLAPEHCD